MKFPIKALVLFASAVSKNVLVLKTAAAEAQADADTTAISVHHMPPNPEPYQVSYSDGTKSPLIRIKVLGALVDSAAHLIYEETLDGYTVQPPVKKGGKYTYLHITQYKKWRNFLIFLRHCCMFSFFVHLPSTQYKRGVNSVYSQLLNQGRDSLSQERNKCYILLRE